MKDEVPMGQLVIKKTDAEDQTPLANVEFELKNKETEEVVGKLTTDKDGVEPVNCCRLPLTKMVSR